MENVQKLMGVSIEKIKEMVDVNTVVGTPINTADGTTIIPISRISVGFVSGGSDLPTKSQNELFGGGSGAGINIVPIAFLVVANGDVRVLHMASHPDVYDRLVDLIPTAIDGVTGVFKKKDKDAE